MLYNLIETNGGRVVLTNDLPSTHDTLLDSIEAKDWVSARSKLSESDIYHNPGYGWFRR